MGNVRVALATRNNRLEQIVADLDAGTGPAVLRIYDGAQPADANTAVTTQNLLAELEFDDPSGSVAAGVLTFNAISDDASADDDGTATWARALDSDNNVVFDCDVDVTASGATLEFDDVDFVTGGTVTITSFTLTEAAS